MPAAGAGPRLLTFNAVFGDLVVNHRGDTLGTLSDVLLDLGIGRIAYAVVSTGGFMGKGERLYPIPWSAVGRDANRHCFTLVTEKRRFESGPGFDKPQLPSVFNAKLHLDIHQHYDSRPYWL